MEFIDILQLEKRIQEDNVYEKMLIQMETEVVAFAKDFKDDPKWTSAWGHNHFCKKDGSVLTYNPKDSKNHVCPLCKTVYTDKLFEQVWIYIYRNEAILTLYKAALIFKVTKKQEYLDIFKKISEFYMDHYEEFELHDKSGNIFDSIETMGWGCGRLMPQGLNESISMIRFFAGASIIKDDLDENYLSKLNVFIGKVYALLKPQVDKIHNISCWVNSAIGVMGLFSNNEEMIRFVFEGELNIRRQLREGVTSDRFWYEGSIHYNFFTLEGISYLALFAKQFGYEFGDELSIVREMFEAAYAYAFTSHRLPNPNDGWPNVNLKTYSFIYSVGTKVFGNTSSVGNILGNILLNEEERGLVPLSKPYYYQNTLSLEQFAYLPDFNWSGVEKIEKKSMNFEASNFALLINDKMNLFYKYGHNSYSHAHPDKMTIELMFNNKVITRDLSNAGYGSIICNEWHRCSSSHNTVVVDGLNHESVEPGVLINFAKDSVEAKALDVYKGIDFKRSLSIEDSILEDSFEVTGNDTHTFDYIMHIEGEYISDYPGKPGDLGFNQNGYQHIQDVEKIELEKASVIKWRVGDLLVECQLNSDNTEVFIAKSPDNPITSLRSTLILRQKGRKASFDLNWNIIES